MHKKIIPLAISIIVLFATTGAAIIRPYSDQICYPFERGVVCIDDTMAPTETSTLTHTITPTATSTATPTETPVIYSWQVNYDFYRDPQTALVGTADSSAWLWPGNALTASTIPIYPTRIYNTTIDYARWVVVWNPNTDSVPTKVRLVSADSGPSNIVEIAQVSSTNYHTPIVSAVTITAALQSLVDGQSSPKFLGQQTLGNGSNGGLIYASWIEVVWKTN